MLMMNPNLQGNPLGNMMLAMMMQQTAANKVTQNINTNTVPNKGDSSSLSALNELKELANKYKNVMSVEDKNRMDFLIDSLAKKI